MATIQVICPNCKSDNVIKHGTTPSKEQRFLCKNVDCKIKTFLLNYQDIGRLQDTKKTIVEMAINGSGIRDTARVLGISTTTVLNTLRSYEYLIDNVNYKLLEKKKLGSIEVDIRPLYEVEMDEMWSFVKKKSEQRWIWIAIDHNTGDILAYVFGRRKDEIFLKLKELLQSFKIKRYYTDNWGSYYKYLDEDKHRIGKRNTQKIERKNLTLRTRIKRLARKTICFSKSIRMHDIVIGLLINTLDFGFLI